VAVVAGLLAACGAGASDDGAQTPSTAPPPVNTSSSPVAPAAQTTGTSPSIPFDAARAWEHLQRQVAFGPRPAGSEALAACRRYIIEQLKSVGLEVREQAFRGDTPAGSIPMVNVSAVIPGRRPERIIIGTHYDTKLFRDIRFLGASDGASSTAAAIELARVLSGRAGEYTIELLFLDGEEAVLEWAGTDHTYGSRHYVEEAQRTGDIDAIKAFVLLDMIGDRDLDIRRDANSTPWLVDVVWQTAARLGHARTFVDVLTTIEDDHIPFVRAGIPSVDIIDLNYAAWHTADDDLSRVSANSLQVVGDVVLAALPEIERRLAAQPR
jgi:Zn-dependent M28 family amino/carboxypeptidase